LARIKRGRYAYIARAEDIERSVAVVYNQISRPLLTGVSFDVKGAASDRKVYPRTLPDLFVDDELVITGRLRGGAGPATFSIRGVLDGKPVELERIVDLASRSVRPWVGRHWARARVEHLIEDIALDGESAEMVKEVTDLALAYNFVTDYTAFLAIPESELTADAREVLDRARADRAEVMSRHADAAALARAKRAQPVAVSAAAEPADFDDEGDTEELSSPGQVEGRRGCAGCASGGPGGLGGALLALIALGFSARRRRAPRAAGRRGGRR
jgi:Ca-activated chloride channel family protein